MIPFVVKLLQGIKMLCVSNSFVQKPRHESDGYFLCYNRFQQLHKKMGKCFFVTLACNKLFSTLGTEVINQREHEKQFRNQILKKNFFTLPGLESEV